MRRLARGATILALAVALHAEAAPAAGHDRAGAGANALAYDHMEYVLAPDLPGTELRMVKSEPGQSIRVRC